MKNIYKLNISVNDYIKENYYTNILCILLVLLYVYILSYIIIKKIKSTCII